MRTAVTALMNTAASATSNGRRHMGDGSRPSGKSSGGSVTASSPTGTNRIAATSAAAAAAGTVPGAVRNPRSAYSKANASRATASPAANRSQPSRFRGLRATTSAPNVQSSNPKRAKIGSTLPRKAMIATGTGVAAFRTTSTTVAIASTKAAIQPAMTPRTLIAPRPRS